MRTLERVVAGARALRVGWGPQLLASWPFSLEEEE